MMEPRITDPHRASRPVDVPEPAPESSTAKAPVAAWRRIVPALAISVMAAAYVYATVPFTFAGAVECRQHGLSGAAPAPGTPAGTIIGDVNRRCADAGNSRMAVAGVTAALAAVIGLAGAFAPTDAEVRARSVGGITDDEWARWEVRTWAGAAS
ncbi:MAG: hypothetical protein ACR2K0_08750 [Acidimicrobiales bacterium]